MIVHIRDMVTSVTLYTVDLPMVPRLDDVVALPSGDEVTVRRVDWVVDNRTDRGRLETFVILMCETDGP